MALRVEASEDKGRLLIGVFVRAETRKGRTIAAPPKGSFLATASPTSSCFGCRTGGWSTIPEIPDAERAQLPDPGPPVDLPAVARFRGRGAARSGR